MKLNLELEIGKIMQFSSLITMYTCEWLQQQSHKDIHLQSLTGIHLSAISLCSSGSASMGVTSALAAAVFCGEDSLVPDGSGSTVTSGADAGTGADSLQQNHRQQMYSS